MTPRKPDILDGIQSKRTWQTGSLDRVGANELAIELGIGNWGNAEIHACLEVALRSGMTERQTLLYMVRELNGLHQEKTRELETHLVNCAGSILAARLFGEQPPFRETCVQCQRQKADCACHERSET